jgi:hypothetical protein
MDARRLGPRHLRSPRRRLHPEIGVYLGNAVATLSAVPTTASASGACPQGTNVDFGVVAGTTYRIAVGGADGGRFELHLIAAAGHLRLLTVRTGGEGSGTVASNPAGIACGTTCRYDFAAGTPLTLVAEAIPGSVFAGWAGGGCAGTGPCTVDVRADSTVTAMFATATDSGTGASDEMSGGGSGSGGSDGVPTIPAKPKPPLKCHRGSRRSARRANSAASRRRRRRSTASTEARRLIISAFALPRNQHG